MKTSTITQTLTLVEEKVKKKAKNTLYLVLKKKGLAEEIIENIDNELEKRFLEFLKKILPKLSEMKFDNPEEALECLLVKQIVSILDDMLKERMLDLSEGDKKLVFDIMNKGEEKKAKNPENQK